MNIVPASEKELKTVVTWITTEQACLSWAGPNVTYPIEFAVLQEEIQFSHRNSFACQKNNELIAFGQLLDAREGAHHLARIIVNPEHQGSGYGKQLCINLIERAAQQNARQVSLKVFEANHVALALYRKLGFRSVAAESSNGVLLMVKNFSG